MTDLWLLSGMQKLSVRELQLCNDAHLAGWSDQTLQVLVSGQIVTCISLLAVDPRSLNLRNLIRTGLEKAGQMALRIFQCSLALAWVQNMERESYKNGHKDKKSMTQKLVQIRNARD